MTRIDMLSFNLSFYFNNAIIIIIIVINKNICIASNGALLYLKKLVTS